MTPLSLTLVLFAVAAKPKDVEYQYQSEGIAIPAASPKEPKVKTFGPESIRAAVKYLDDGAKSWNQEKGCVACHTTGAYMAERPALSRYFGTPPSDTRERFAKLTPEKPGKGPPLDKRTKYEGLSIAPVWRSLGLAEWDKHVTGKLSPETDRSLKDMLAKIHPTTGMWPTYKVLEIPYITTDFELSVHGAQALAIAPGWLKQQTDAHLLKQVELLKTALKNHKPRNDYERALKLQLASFWPDCVSKEDRAAAVDMLWKHQHADGGWSTREMSDFDQWRDEVPEDVVELLKMDTKASDPYMTAFAIILLRGEGVSKTDPRIQKAVQWLKSEQRESGRWWMNTMLKETYYYITYIATAKALTALAACDEFPVLERAK
jgi:squalene-hopene/tetraprenyl-beta-curcumene cyclase